MKKSEIRQPIEKGCAKVPVVMQMEALECGAASLTMVLAYFGRWVPLEQVRSDCGVSRDGSNARNILRAARSYGLTAKAFRMEPAALREGGMFPCIIHWNFDHFVVLCGFKGEKAVLNDPARGNVVVSAQEFDESFTGVVLFFEPSEQFVPGGKPKSILQFAKKRLVGTGTAFAFVVLTSVISALFSVINPAFLRIFMDRLLTGNDPNWAVPFLVALSCFGIVQIVVAWVQAINQLKINGKMAVVGSSTFMWKLLRMPMVFFSQRMAGDLLMRQSDNEQIAETLIHTLAPLVLNACMMIFYLVVMLRYSVLLSLVGLASIAINAAVSVIISNKRVNITRVLMRDSGKLSACTVSGIEMIETIKASGAENGYFQKWSGYQASVNTQNVRFARLSQMLGMVPELVSTLSGALVVCLGTMLTMRGEFTVGMVTAFQGFLTAFMAPAQTFISAGQTIQEMRTQMERVEDVMEYPDDVPADSPVQEGIEYAKLSGKLELRNVTFGYSPLAEPLIRDFNMTLEPGKSVAFVGGSGCGKSTLSRLISGLYKPWSGEILFDGKPISEIDRSIFTGSLAVVDQDITIFEDTIANNIKMWDTSIEDFEMILAARDAQIHDDIMQRDGGYNHKFIEGGRDFSGGQRQRMEIARVLAQDPTIVIMDEATSALDARTEFEVVRAIRDRGITTIVVAHRLSTIRDCDEIIVMDHGQVVERGTHKQLMENGGLYTQLVTSE